MNFTDTIHSVTILFLMMIVGFYAGRKKIITEEVNKGLCELLLNITLPLLIISSFLFEFSIEKLLGGAKIFLYAIFIHGLLIGLSKGLYVKEAQKRRNVLRFITVFSNCGFMGYPILESVYGKIGIFYGSLYVVVFNLFLWTAGVGFFMEKEEEKKNKQGIPFWANPGIVSVFIGLLLFIFSIPLPHPVKVTFEMVGGMTTPLSMLVVGAMLSKQSVKNMVQDKVLYYNAFVKLILAPLCIWMILSLLKGSTVLLNICVIITAMPAAANTAIFAQKFHGDLDTAASGTFVTTLLSIFTIPLWLWFLQ